MAVFRTISKSKKLNFCNFPIHFPCLSGLEKIQTFSPINSILRKRHTQPKSLRTSPIIGPVRGYPSHLPLPNHHPTNPHIFPFQRGPYDWIFLRRMHWNQVQNRLICRKLYRFHAQSQGAWGRLWGVSGMENGRRFCRRIFQIWGDFEGLGRGKSGIFFLVDCPFPGGFLGEWKGKRSAICRRNPTWKGKNWGGAGGGERGEMTTKKGPIANCYRPFSGAIIRETSCASYFRRYQSISKKFTLSVL